MRNYIILNGVNSNTITGLLISTLPPITKPKIRTQTEEIDGRDGDIVTKLGYSAYDKEFEIGLYGDFDINEVISYFNSEGTVVFSNEEDKYYNYQILDQIDYEKLIRFKTATIRMHVQPFKYPLEEEQIQVDATVVEAEGSNISLQYTNPNHIITSELKGDLYQETTTGKNLLPNNATTQEISGVTFTVNEDKSITVNGTATANINYVISQHLTMELGTYTLSGCPAGGSYSTYYLRLALLGSYTFYADTGNGHTKTYSSFTVDNTNTTYGIYIASGTQCDNLVFKPQLEKGSQATPYEEYTGGQPSPNPDYPQEIEVVTGQQEILIETKNLFDKDNANILNDTLVNGTNGTIAGFNGTKTLYIPIQPNTTYTISKMVSARFVVGCCSQTPATNVVCDVFKPNNTGTNITITSGNNDIYLVVFYYLSSADTSTAQEILDSIQIEKGSEATDYVVYHSQSYTIDLGTTELYGIPDTTYRDRVYQDNNTWYIERQVGKVVLNGSETWNRNNDNKYYLSQYGRYFKWNGSTNEYVLISDIAIKPINDTSTSEYKIYNNWNGNIFINHLNIASEYTTSQWATATAGHYIYGVLATPTTEEITDTNLISQLNELQEATTYENTTNISVTGSLPVILKATTSGMPNTVINNIGNIYAKPLITIYGSGTIGVYLNQIQVLQIELGNNGSITIDVSKMEAYNNSTKALMNRLVTGDYMKFLINSGENNIAFSGNVAGFTMDNYTRWL